MERDTCFSDSCREIEALYKTLRQSGTGQISDAAEVHVSPDGTQAVFAGAIMGAAPLLGGADGERLPNVPQITAALNADYQFPVEGLRPALGATLRYVSDRTASFNNNAGFPQYHLPAYTTVDLRTGPVVSSVDVQLYVHNLFDERGQLSAITFRAPDAWVALLQPRTFGISAATRF
jgi:iron complex outermembrane receptor protein